MNTVIITIRNGHITGRKVGDPSTNKGLEFLRNLVPESGDEINYITKTATGKTLRSSSVYFRNSNEQIYWLFVYQSGYFPAFNCREQPS